MKKALLSFLLIFISTHLFCQEISYTIISSDNQSITIRVDFPEIEKQEIDIAGETHFKLSMPGGYATLEKGFPELLMAAKSIMIPEDANPSFTIISEEFTEERESNIVPSKGKLYRDVNPQTVPYQKGEIYAVNNFYPESSCKLNEPYILRDFHGLAITFFPARYNPVTKTLREYQTIIVKISYNSSQSLPNPQKMNREFRQIYHHQFLNFEEAKYNVLAENGSLLIITPESFIPALQPLVDWRIKCGIPTEIVAIETIGSSSSQLKNYITDYYNQNNLTYLLFVGDHAQIPSYRMMSSSMDNYYAEVSGSDVYPDYFLGRFSATTIEEVETQVEKTIMYETAPPEVSHFPVFAGIASNEGPGHNNEYDYQHIRNIGNQLMNYTYTSGHEFFDGNQGGLDAAGFPHASSISSAINQGVGIINYCGHGDWNMFYTGYYTNQYVYALQNYNKLPFIISTACLNGDYAYQTCFAEAWLRAKSEQGLTGAVATLMSTVLQSWNPPMAGQDEMANLITESSGENTPRTFGGITFNGICYLLDIYNDYETSRTWLIFGDPALHIRTSEPKSIAIQHPEEVDNTETLISFLTEIEDVDLTLSIANKIVHHENMGDGELSVAFDDLSLYDSLFVVGTKYNHTPYLGIIRIKNSEIIPEDPTEPEPEIEAGILYPNPAKDYVTISEKDFPSEEKVDCFLFDMNGRQVMKTTATKTNNKLDVRLLNSGGYVLKMYSGGKEIHTYKLIII